MGCELSKGAKGAHVLTFLVTRLVLVCVCVCVCAYVNMCISMVYLNLFEGIMIFVRRGGDFGNFRFWLKLRHVLIWIDGDLNLSSFGFVWN